VKALRLLALGSVMVLIVAVGLAFVVYRRLVDFG